eukprot:jgi/Botrbrau1/21219/Bobra.39_2s0020.1
MDGPGSTAHLSDAMCMMWWGDMWWASVTEAGCRLSQQRRDAREPWPHAALSTMLTRGAGNLACPGHDLAMVP